MILALVVLEKNTNTAVEKQLNFYLTSLVFGLKDSVNGIGTTAASTGTFIVFPAITPHLLTYRDLLGYKFPAIG